MLHLVMEFVDGPALAAVLAPTAGTASTSRCASATRVAGVCRPSLRPVGRATSSRATSCWLSDGVVKLADFGIAKRLDDLAADLTATGQFVGTPTYLAPEQATGAPATAVTDHCSTAVLLFEMLAGSPSFAGGAPTPTALAGVRTPPRVVMPTAPTRRRGRTRWWWLARGAVLMWPPS